MINLRGQTAVVTGGGRGLGRACAKALAAAGAGVIVVARTQAELDETVTSIGGSARAYVADVTDAARVGEIFREIDAVDLLVNNAGVVQPIGPFAQSNFEDW